MPDTMLAVVKPEPKPGSEVRQVPIPSIGPRDVLVKVKVAAVCGTDLHIYNWDPWAAGRIHPPLVPGHEFCGEVAEVGKEVTLVKPGDFVSAEMHIACGKCYQCRIGESHICRRLSILGVDADGAFAEFVRIPESNIWKIDPAIPPDFAAVLDPLGNAVHTALAGEIIAQNVAVVGCGPIGLFSIAVCQAVGAARVFALEINPYRRTLAHKMKADLVLDPATDDAVKIIHDQTEGIGVDVVLEMSGHPDGIRTGFKLLRLGGRMSMLGTPTKRIELDLAGDIIFKGATVQGIHGRRMYQTWYQMTRLLKSGKLDISPAITHRIALKDFSQGMQHLQSGDASKLLLYPNGVR